MPPQTIILLPVFDDWRAVGLLLPRLNEAVAGEAFQTAVLLVDDGSLDAPPGDLLAGTPPGFQWVRILRLNRNLGHQRAIAVGLSYIEEHLPCQAIVVMDADGEDRPEDIPRLLQRSREDGGVSIVFAERQRRAEGIVFRVFYQLYRALHRLLTGTDVRVGSFSVIPRARLLSVVTVSELWIHYAASAFRSRQPVVFVRAARGVRLAGRSRMDFVGLVVHGLSAISVYSDVVFTRLVVMAGVIAGVALFLLMAGIGLRVLTDLAVPEWTPYAFGLLCVIVFQAITFMAALTFLILGSRQQMTFVPRRDYGTFVGSVTERASEPAGVVRGG